MDVVGGKYVAPESGEIVLDLPNQADNAQITFAGARIDEASLAPQLDRVFRITDTQQALFDTGFSNPALLTLRITPSTGRLQGTFRLQDADPTSPRETVVREVSFHGVLIPVLGIGAGHFQLAQLPEAGPPATTEATSPILSGQVVLAPAP